MLRTMSSAPEGLHRDASLKEVDIDSLDLVELTQMVNEECGVTLPQINFSGVDTVGDVVDLLASSAQ